MEKRDTVTPSLSDRQPEPLWGFKDVADYMGVTEITVRAHMQKRGLPYKRVGKRVYFRRSEVDAWIDANPSGEAA